MPHIALPGLRPQEEGPRRLRCESALFSKSRVFQATSFIFWGGGDNASTLLTVSALQPDRPDTHRQDPGRGQVLVSGSVHFLHRKAAAGHRLPGTGFLPGQRVCKTCRGQRPVLELGLGSFALTLRQLPDT